VQVTVHIEQIHPDGLVLEKPITAELLSTALTEGGRAAEFRAQTGFSVHAEFQKVGRGVLLRARFKAEFVGTCKRCLADVPLGVPVDFTLNLIPEVNARKDEAEDEAGKDDDGQAPVAGSFALNDADEEVFDGRNIELDPILREQVLLALPMSVVCREDCKGLCPSCGKDLNEGACGCRPPVTDPRLAVLKNIKIN